MSYPPPAVVEISDDDEDGGDSSAVLTNKDKHRLLEVLNSLESTGNIAASRHYAMFPNPGLTMEGGNLIPLPLKEDDAQTIKGACRQAPFGHGDKTLVDTSVRDTWELDASKFELANPEWPKFFDRMLRDTATGLGFDEVFAKPYKLLLYEPGSFFKPHKDSEKERGMVGTLIVCLPSQHEGGDVHLSFGSQVKRFSTAPTSKFDLTSISWFSDVTHEVTKLTSGYRLVVTYKLFIRGDGSLSASTALEKTERLKSMLVKWKSRPSKPDRILYPLDHLYTETSLCLANLKGRDRAVACSLNKICSEAGFYFMLAHATHVRTGDDGVGAYGYYEEEEEEYTNLTSVYTPLGVQVASNVNIEDDDILGYNINKEDPDSEDEGEFTGNENMPSTFRYHKTVVFLVPKDRLRKYIDRNVFASSILKAENDCLAEMVLQDLSNNRDDTYTKQAAVAFVDNILSCSEKPQGPIVGLIAKRALELNNIAMFRTCVRATYAPLGSRPLIVNDFPFFAYRKAIGNELISYLRANHDGQEHAIDWDYWLQDLDQTNDIATEFDAFCSVFKSSTEHEPLLESFRAWADPIGDKKLASQTLWTFSDEKYLLHILESRNADSEWVLQSFLPTVVPRFHRSLLWSFLRSITAGRFGPFKNSRELYKCIIEYGKGQLSLCGNDIIFNSIVSTRNFENHDYDHRTPCKEFVRMISESYMHGAGQEALGLLEQSYKKLVKERRAWLSVSAHYLRINFLEPLVIALETYNVPPVPAIREFFEVALRDICHQPVMTQPVQLIGWAHEKVFCTSLPNCSCRELNCFLENPQQQVWHFPALLTHRRHVECQLTDPIYALQTAKDRSPHTLVVTKLGTNYDRTYRIWKQGAQKVAHSLSWMRRDYVKLLLGEEGYNALVMLGEPSQENAGTTSQAYKDPIQPCAKRIRIWE